MGISDKFHFDWHREVAEDIHESLLENFSGPLSTLCLGDMQEPALVSKLKSLGIQIHSMTFFDVQNHGQTPDHIQGNINDLSALKFEQFDLVTCFRSSVFINDKNNFLNNLQRILKPGGVALVDWLHGKSEQPVIDFSGGGPIYNGIEYPFNATYIDGVFLTQFSDEFVKFFKHINKPPLTGFKRLNPLLAPFRKPVNDLNNENYLNRLQTAFEAKGAQLITEADFLSRGMSVKKRSARYFYPRVGKFNLFVFTVIQKHR